MGDFNWNFLSSLDTISLLEVIDRKYNDKKAIILRIPEVYDKIKRDLLKDCNRGDVYKNFQDVFGIVGLDFALEILDYDMVINFYKIVDRKNVPELREAILNGDFEKRALIEKEIDDSISRRGNYYKLFVRLFDLAPDRVMEWILKSDDLFVDFMSIYDTIYSVVGMFDHDTVIDMIFKAYNLKKSGANVSLKFIGYVDRDVQKSLFTESIDDEMLLEIFPYLSNDAISYFFVNDRRADYFFDVLNETSDRIRGFVRSGMKVKRSIAVKSEYFEMLKDENLSNFRRIINDIERVNAPDVIEKKVSGYYADLIGQYDFNLGIFKCYNDYLEHFDNLNREQYDVYLFDQETFWLIRSYRYYDGDRFSIENKEELIEKLKRVTSNKISEIVVEALFSDSIYNVWINIKEMLRFNAMLSEEDRILNDERVSFYTSILNFDNISSEDKITLYHELKDKNVSTLFYDDLSRLKDCSYELIKKKLVNLSRDNYELSSEERGK